MKIPRPAVIIPKVLLLIGDNVENSHLGPVSDLNIVKPDSNVREGVAFKVTTNVDWFRVAKVRVDGQLCSFLV